MPVDRIKVIRYLIRLASELRNQLLAKVDAKPRDVRGDGAADPPPRPVAPELGELSLEGQGQRGGLRCRTFVGKVLESGAPAGRVGRFAMRLSLPIKTDTWELERRYQRRIASRPSPPLVYPRLGFVGRWRLLMFMGDEGSPPAYFPIQMHPDGSWQSVGAAHALAGTWGMYARDASSASGWSDAQQPLAP